MFFFILVDGCVRGLPSDIGFLISKGIASNDDEQWSSPDFKRDYWVKILPGCSVVRTPDSHPHFPTYLWYCSRKWETRTLWSNVTKFTILKGFGPILAG